MRINTLNLLCYRKMSNIKKPMAIIYAIANTETMTLSTFFKPQTVAKIKYKSRNGNIIEVCIDDDFLNEKYGLKFLDRVQTDKGLATVIGHASYNYSDSNNCTCWFHLDSDKGASIWDEMQVFIFFQLSNTFQSIFCGDKNVEHFEIGN